MLEAQIFRASSLANSMAALRLLQDSQFKTGFMETDLTRSRPSSQYKYGFFAIIVLFVALASVFVYYLSTQNAAASRPETLITQAALEKQYGLRVNLVAVTAAGGMVDLRLKLLDGDKARTLLQEKNNFPILHLDQGNITLNPSEDAKSRDITFEDNGNLFLLYPNAGNAVKPGSSITVRFGDIALEPIEVQ
jgi:hypothetical protein